MTELASGPRVRDPEVVSTNSVLSCPPKELAVGYFLFIMILKLVEFSSTTGIEPVGSGNIKLVYFPFSEYLPSHSSVPNTKHLC